MKISIAVASHAPEGYPAIYKNELFQSIKKAHELGYSGIEWHLRKPDFNEVQNIKEHCDKLHIRITAVGTGMACSFDGLTLMHPDSDIRVRAVERLKEFVDMAVILDSSVIIGSIKGRIPFDGVQEVYRDYLKENLKKTLEYAERENVIVVLEALNRYETNILNTAEQTDAFVKEMGSNLLKTHLDTFHMNIEEPDICKSIEKCAGTLGNVHLADSNRWYPGAGHIDFKPIMETLSSIGYTGPVGIECLPFPKMDIAAKNAIDYLQSIQ